MNNIYLLDCTLRDGGYVNDWNFGQNALINVVERLVSANVDFVELGFLDQRRNFDINRSIMPNTQCVEKIYGKIDKSNTQFVAMIDYGTCDLNNIQPCEDTLLDGIRVIFKKHVMNEALDFCAEIKKLGYKVFVQCVSITSYEDDELLRLIDKVNAIKPYAVSIVDTYGLLHKGKLLHYYELMNQHLLPEICIGYHSHNNFQLAYSNCLEVAEIHDLSKRSLLLDSSVFGMGKGAGNSPTELLAMSLNDNFNKHYDLTQILEAIDINITEIFRQAPWGYSMKYFIAASNDCHPNYVSFLLDKQTLSVKSVNEILHRIAPSKKLLYDQSYIETLYLDFQKSTSDDEADYKRLSLLLQNKKILVIGPGKTVDTEKDKILSFIEKNQPVIIAINFIPDWCKSDFVFITNSKRYVRQASVMNFLGSDIKSIATSNVTKSSGNFDFVLDYEKLIDKDAVIPDNSLLMLLRVAKLISVKNLALAGFDGYSTSRESNYFQSEMEYENIKQKYDAINTEVSTFIEKIKDKLNIEFITTTLYDVE